MKIIGITGPTGAGKSTVSELFQKYGAEHIDCDIIAKEVVESNQECLKRLSEEFGSDIIKDGRLDRSLLASRAFASREKTEKLNAITHGYITAEIARRIEEIKAKRAKAVTVDAAALKESGFDKQCDVLICVMAKADERLSRLINRDAISAEKLRQRINAQVSGTIYEENTDIVIINDGSLQELEQKVCSAAGTLGLCDDNC